MEMNAVFEVMVTIIMAIQDKWEAREDKEVKTEMWTGIGTAAVELVKPAGPLEELNLKDV